MDEADSEEAAEAFETKKTAAATVQPVPEPDVQPVPTRTDTG